MRKIALTKTHYTNFNMKQTVMNQNATATVKDKGAGGEIYSFR